MTFLKIPDHGLLGSVGRVLERCHWLSFWNCKRNPACFFNGLWLWMVAWGWYRLFPLSDACVYVKEWDLNESRASCMPSVHKGVQNQIDTHAMQAKPVVGPFLNTFYCCHKFRNCSTKNFSVDWSWFHRFLFQFSIFQDGKWKRQLKICQGGTWILDHHFRLHNSWIFKHCKIF